LEDSGSVGGFGLSLTNHVTCLLSMLREQTPSLEELRFRDETASLSDTRRSCLLCRGLPLSPAPFGFLLYIVGCLEGHASYSWRSAPVYLHFERMFCLILNIVHPSTPRRGLSYIDYGVFIPLRPLSCSPDIKKWSLTPLGVSIYMIY